MRDVDGEQLEAAGVAEAASGPVPPLLFHTDILIRSLISPANLTHLPAQAFHEPHVDI